MPTPHTQANPFAMMLDPAAVLAQIERSERLGGLERRVCRPLDKPLIGRVCPDALASFDRELDLESDDDVADVDGEPFGRLDAN